MKVVPPNGLGWQNGLQVLWEDGEVALCRGWSVEHHTQRTPICAIVPLSDHPATATLNRLAHEYALRSVLDPAWALRPVDLLRERGRTILLLEDPGGEPLERLLGDHPMPMGVFLPLAVRIASAVNAMHRSGLIHKDIKPGHIIVDETTGALHLTGFGLASPTRKEHAAPEPPELVGGTLAYMAPEQTGRMNRSVDSRSDLYALGVTFYQMITGALPFEAADPLTWVHCHIARQPKAPSERVEGLPGAVSAIVIKLLAKAAEDRYQTAAGVVADLERCVAQWRTDGEVRPFPLGAEDRPAELRIPEKLYGREREATTLLAAFERVVAMGRSEFVLVSGSSGAGKSAMVNELHKAIVGDRALFAVGKFDEHHGDIPYATIAQAFRMLLRHVLAQSDEAVARWRTAILDAITPNGQLLIELIPELELVIGKQPECPRLGAHETEHRFVTVWRRLLAVFAQPEHPLVLFLDDLQWMDAGTRRLLAHLMTNSEVRHVLFIGACRDDDVGPGRPLWATLHEARTGGARITEIALRPLSGRDVRQLVGEALNCGERAAPLARLLHRKTLGNPFFVVQFLTALWEDGLLVFDVSEDAWTWDLKTIEDKGYTDNVVDLMLRKLMRLPRRTQEALQAFACLGSTADVATLALAEGCETETTNGALSRAVGDGLVYRRADTYGFLHDRIQEAAYALIPEPLRASAHAEIGRRLALGLTQEALQERIFEVVDQCNRGASLISQPGERRRIAGFNLIAGQRAKTTGAYASALTYFAAGAEMLRQDCGGDRELAFALDLNRAECEFLTSAFGEADTRLSDLSARAANLPDLAAVICLRVALYTTMDRSDLAVEACLEYLRQAGVAWTPHPSDEEVAQEYDLMWRLIGERPIGSLCDLPLMSDPDQRATMDVLTELIAPAAQFDENLRSLANVRMVNLSLQHGNTDGSAFAYICVGAVLAVAFGNHPAAVRFGKLGVALADKPGMDRFRARVDLGFSHLIIPWVAHMRDGESLGRRALQVAHERGDLTFATYASYYIVKLLLASGEPLDRLEEEADRALAYAREARFGLLAQIDAIHLALVRTLRGRTSSVGSFDAGEFDESLLEGRLAEDPRLAWAECVYWVRKMQARVIAGDYTSAVAAAPRAKARLWTLPGNFEAAEYEFYAALAHAGACDVVEDRASCLEALAAHRRQLEAWAENCAENFEDRACLVAAELARLEGRGLEAQHLYQRAIDAARRNGFIHNQALANEIAARFYLDQGLETSAAAHLRNARACYAQWGADGKVHQLDQQHPGLAGSERPTSELRLGTPATQLDLVSVVQASEAISGQIELDRLIETLMRIAIENSGADRGLLIVPHQTSYCIEAEARSCGENVVVARRNAETLANAQLAVSVLRYVMRTQEYVLVDDAAQRHPYSQDPYLSSTQPRSILCLPLTKQSRLVAVLYLENALTPHAFTAERIELLKILTGQAVISLENAQLYSDLREREAKVRRIFQSNIIGAFFWDSGGNITDCNDAVLRLLGYTRQDLEAGKVRWSDMTPPEYGPADEKAWASLRARGSCGPYEKEFIRKDGSCVPILMGGAMFEGSQDEGVAFVLDLTERKQAELRQKTLVDELNHRVKNTLATVQSICAQTVRSAESPAAFQEDFNGRLLALSQTHNVLNQSGWQGASLRQILEMVLASYAQPDRPRFNIDGADVRVGPTSAVALGMAFHELATNALKYGALSTAGGRVRIAWDVRAGDQLHIHWEESGGPEVEPPGRRGFGSRLIERSLSAQLRCQVHLEFLPQGVSCTIEGPLENIR